MKKLSKLFSVVAILAFVCSVSMNVRAADPVAGNEGKLVAEKSTDTKAAEPKAGDSVEKKDMKAAPKKDANKGAKPMKHAKKEGHSKDMHKQHAKKDAKKSMKKEEGKKTEGGSDTGAGEKY